MLPIVFEWQWEIGRLIFMGIAYSVILVMGLGLAAAVVRTVRDLKQPGRNG